MVDDYSECRKDRCKYNISWRFGCVGGGGGSGAIPRMIAVATITPISLRPKRSNKYRMVKCLSSFKKKLYVQASHVIW